MSVCRCGSPLSVTGGGQVFCRACIVRRVMKRGKCCNGHDLRPETIRVSTGKKLATVCRECNAAKHRRYRRRDARTHCACGEPYGRRVDGSRWCHPCAARRAQLRRPPSPAARVARQLRRDQLDEMVVERIVRGGFERPVSKPSRREWFAVLAAVGGRVTAGELARRAGVSDRTVYRMQRLHRAAQAA